MNEQLKEARRKISEVGAMITKLNETAGHIYDLSKLNEYYTELSKPIINPQISDIARIDELVHLCKCELAKHLVTPAETKEWVLQIAAWAIENIEQIKKDFEGLKDTDRFDITELVNQMQGTDIPQGFCPTVTKKEILDYMKGSQ